MPFEVVGIMDNVIVRFVDLSPHGVGLLSPHAVTPGRVVQLQVDLPQREGGTRESGLRLRVSSCRLTEADRAADPRVWRIGGTVTMCDDADRDALVEAAEVLVARSVLSATARLLTELAALEPASDGLALEAPGVAGSLTAGG